MAIDYGEYRSRARSLGRKQGFLEANRKRRESKQARIQELSTNTALQKRTQAKAQAKAITAASVAEETEINAQLESGDLTRDPSGKLAYTETYFKKKAAEFAGSGTANFETPEAKAAYISNPATIKQMQSEHGKYRNRTYKPTAEVSRLHQQHMLDIDQEELTSSQRTAMTGLDKLISGAFGGSTRDAPSTPIAPMDSGLVPEDQKNFSKFDKSEAPEISAVRDNSLSYETEREPLGKQYDDDGNEYFDVVSVKQFELDSKGKRTGSIIEEKGIMNEQGVFVPMSGLVPEKPEKEQKGPLGAFVTDSTKKQKNEANKVLSQATQSDRLINGVISKYTSIDWGSSKLYHSLEDTLFAASTLARDPSVGLDHKLRALDLMKQSEVYTTLPMDLQVAIAKGNFKEIASLADSTSRENIRTAIDLLNKDALTSKEQETLQRLRTADISGALQPLVRSLLRMWTNGENRVAFGASEKLLDMLEGSSGTENIVGILGKFQRNGRQIAIDNLEVKWDASKYSFGQDSTVHRFLPSDIETEGEVLPAREYLMDPDTHQYMMVLTGTAGNGKPYRYFLQGQGSTVIEYALPHKGFEGDARSKQYTDALLERFSQEINPVTGDIVSY